MTRGELWWADLGLPLGSEPGFRRPVLVIQEDAFNASRIGTILCIPLTTNLALAEAPGNVLLAQGDSGLSRDSVIVVSQVGALDRSRFLEPIARLGEGGLREVEKGLSLVLGLRRG